MRVAAGSQKAIEPGVKEKLFQNNHRLDKYFEGRKLVYRKENSVTKKSENLNQFSVVCKNLPGLIDKILHER